MPGDAPRSAGPRRRPRRGPRTNRRDTSTRPGSTSPRRPPLRGGRRRPRDRVLYPPRRTWSIRRDRMAPGPVRALPAVVLRRDGGPTAVVAIARLARHARAVKHHISASKRRYHITQRLSASRPSTATSSSRAPTSYSMPSARLARLRPESASSAARCAPAPPEERIYFYEMPPLHVEPPFARGPRG